MSLGMMIFYKHKYGNEQYSTIREQIQIQKV